MREFRLNEISAVDRPAQKGARMTIMKRADDLPPEVEAYLKRDFSTEQRKKDAKTGAAMPGGGYPIENGGDLKNAIQAFGRAKNKTKTKAHIITRARALGLTDQLPADWKTSKLELLAKVTNQEAVDAFESVLKDYQSAMMASDFNEVQAECEAREYANGMLEEIDEAVCSLRAVCQEIACDESGRDKAALLQESFDQFKQHIQGVVPEGIENAMAALALSEAGFEIAASGALQKREEDHMPFDIKKFLGLPATATDADVQKALEVRETEGALGRNIAKMSSDHVAYMNSPHAHLPTGGKEAFAAMSVEKRDEIIKQYPAMSDEDKKKADAKAKADAEADAKKRAASDEILSVGGVQILKSVVGDGPFAVMKAQQESIIKLEDDRAAEAFVKRADSLGHIGKGDEIGKMLHKISKHDPKLADQVEAVLKVADERIKKGGLLSEIGKGGAGTFSKAAETIETMAKEMVSKGLAKTLFKAKDMVRLQNPELAKQEQDENKAKYKAA